MLERPPLESFVGARINSYLVDQLLEQSELGALFLARDSSSGTQYVLGVLTLSLAAEVSGYPTASHALETFAHQASTIASLQHPYILPLVDYGSVGDMPYLAWPSVPTRPLSSRIAQGGSLDLLTVGRYLDQIAGALEYAHEHLVLHRSLTVDALSLQRDGRILVHDFGIRRMLEQGRKDAEWYALRNWNEACAPEQILGLAANPATDVYALGVILYQLLTGEPPYAGVRRKDIMQQHLQAPIPSLRLRRPDLPSELDDVLATALAKQGGDRFSQPGALANAYYDIVSPQQVGRVPFKLNTNTTTNSINMPIGNAVVHEHALYTPQRSAPAHSTQPGSKMVSDRTEFPQAFPRSRNSQPLAKPALRYSRGLSPLRTMLIAGALVALLLGTVLTVSRLQSDSAPIPSGQVSFMDSSPQALGETDALAIHVSGLTTPQSGYAYHAWMINQQTERVLALGELVEHGQTYSLSYHTAGGLAVARTNLLAMGTLLEVTLEQGTVSLPSGKVVMSGTFPPLAFVHVGHLLVSFPTTPGQTGLLVGSAKQTSLLDAQAQALSTAATHQNVSAIECEAQSMLDIIQGTAGPQYHPLSGVCNTDAAGTAGDGFGLLGTISPTYNTLTGYLATASEHAALAATQPDATSNLRTHAHQVEIAIANVEGWVTTIQQDALLLQKTPLAPSIASEILTLANEAQQGVDRNGNHQIDPVAGEAGMATAYSEGQQMALLTLVSKD